MSSSARCSPTPTGSRSVSGKTSPQGCRRRGPPEREAEHAAHGALAHDQALAQVMQHLLKDDTQVWKQFVENESFKRFVGDMVYAITSQ
jgi:hypothetical protein